MSRFASRHYEALACFRYILRKFLRFSKNLLRTSRLTPEQYETLLAVKAFSSREGMTIVQLSDRLQVEHHSAVFVVDRLVAHRLVVRRVGATDRRVRHVLLTRKGEQVLSKLATGHRRELRKHGADIIRQLDGLKR
jgi:DNA-binding MarR family transcriptional regulator